MADKGEKVRCPKCDRPYYKKKYRGISCPYCAKDALIADATTATLQLEIKHGGHDDDELCLEGGVASKAKSGNIYLRGIVRVISGEQKGKEFSMPIGISSLKGDRWTDMGRDVIRSILNSSQGLSPHDMSRKAIFGRVIDSYEVLDGIAFVGVVGVAKSQQGRDENVLSKVLTAGDNKYDLLVESGSFVPAVKASPPLKSTEPEWLKV
jgi:hypothetical protein